MGTKRAYGSREGASLYTDLDLDRGVGMKFHPLCGIELRRLSYDFESRWFSFTFHFGGWCMEGKRVTYDRISGGGSWRVGEPYPSHWKFHPLTGKALKGSNAMTEQIVSYTSEQIDAGQFGMKFHPVTGEEMAQFTLVRLDPGSRRLYCCAGWNYKFFPRIGDGSDRKTGELYHEHWRFDPFTGQPLSGASVRGLWEQE